MAVQLRLCNDESNENGKETINRFGLLEQQFWRASRFLYISMLSLHDHDV